MTTFATPTRVRPTTVHPVTFPRLVHAELLKLRTLRSTLIVAALVVLSTVVGMMAFADHGTAMAIASGSALGVIFIAVLGALSFPVEVNSGTVQPTLLAGPRRSSVLVAKAAVIAIVSATLTIVGDVIGCIVIGAGFEPAMIGQVLLSGVAMALVGPMFLFAGVMIRSVPAAVTVAILFSILLQNIIGFVRIGGVFLSDYLPSESSTGLVLASTPGEFVRCLLVLLVWLTAVALPAMAMLRSRDA